MCWLDEPTQRRRAAADAAGHVLLESDLAWQVELSRQLRDGLQHRRRAAGEHLHLGALGFRHRLQRVAREIRDVTAVRAGQAGVAREARGNAPLLEQGDGPRCSSAGAGHGQLRLDELERERHLRSH